MARAGRQKDDARFHLATRTAGAVGGDRHVQIAHPVEQLVHCPARAPFRGTANRGDAYPLHGVREVGTVLMRAHQPGHPFRPAAKNRHQNVIVPHAVQKPPIARILVGQQPATSVAISMRHVLNSKRTSATAARAISVVRYRLRIFKIQPSAGELLSRNVSAAAPNGGRIVSNRSYLKCQLCSHLCRPSLPQRRLPPQDVMVVLGEAVGFVADVLQEPQGVGVLREPTRLGLAGHVDFFLALGQREDERRLEPIASSAATAALSCPLPPSISRMSGSDSPSLREPQKPPADHFANRGEVVDALHACGSCSACSRA